MSKNVQNRVQKAAIVPPSDPFFAIS